MMRNIDMRTYIKAKLIFIVILIYFLTFLSGCSRKGTNFLIFVADDLGFSDIGLYNLYIESPNLNAIFAQGIQFTNFYVEPTDNATLLSLLTGMFASRLGIISSEHKISCKYLNKMSEIELLPKILKKRGYDTAFIGKAFLEVEDEYSMFELGFKYFYCLFAGEDKRHKFYRNGEIGIENGNFTYLIERSLLKVSIGLGKNESKLVAWSTTCPNSVFSLSCSPT